MEFFPSRQTRLRQHYSAPLQCCCQVTHFETLSKLINLTGSSTEGQW